MFRVAARTVLQLGAELISSDAVAFYELIKNAFDAGSPKVTIRVVVRIPRDTIGDISTFIRLNDVDAKTRKEQQEALAQCRELIEANIIHSAPGADELSLELQAATTWGSLSEIVDEANYIDIEDTGSGMSLTDLDEIYLTIGTRSRLRERELAAKTPGDKRRPILGEKGLGRLSAMRLGWKLHVKTSKSGERYWSDLHIDWRIFAHDSDALIEDIDVKPSRSDKKSDPDVSGTVIRISALTSDWDAGKLERVAESEFSKLTDPFTRKSRYPIRVSFNGRSVRIPVFDELLFKYAHAEVHAEFTLDGPQGPRLSGKVIYKLRNREKTFELDGAHLVSTAKLPSLRAARSLGPFTAKCVWINRKTLKELEKDIEEVKRVIALQELWAGGLMVYRDGFRVYPYGSLDDDWLNLDKKALSSGGYKVNRRQVVGKVDISSTENPVLLDQSNREGLRDSAEKQTLILLLKYVLESEFRPFLNKVDKEHKSNEPVSFEDLEERIGESEERIVASLRSLVQRHPEVGEDAEIVRSLKDAVENLRRKLQDAKALAESFEAKHAQVVHLAATGIMIEMLAHELNRATSNTLDTLSDADRETHSPRMTNILTTLKSELKTLQKRLSILDPLSTAGRQRKETCELTTWVQEVMASHESRFLRDGITCNVRVVPKGTTLKVKLVKGMITQILGNLVSNSEYWLKQEKKLDRSLDPEIRVVVDTTRNLVTFSDNGPGIPVARRDEVFEPFVTTKPPGEGKGLGLYIAREVARYNGATLTLSPDTTGHPKRLHTFVLALEGATE